MKDIDCHVKNVGAYLVGNGKPICASGDYCSHKVAGS